MKSCLYLFFNLFLPTFIMSLFLHYQVNTMISIVIKTALHSFMWMILFEYNRFLLHFKIISSFITFSFISLGWILVVSCYILEYVCFWDFGYMLPRCPLEMLQQVTLSLGAQNTLCSLYIPWCSRHQHAQLSPANW